MDAYSRETSSNVTALPSDTKARHDRPYLDSEDLSSEASSDSEAPSSPVAPLVAALQLEPTVSAVATSVTHFSSPNSALDSPNDLLELLQTTYEPPSPDHQVNQSITPFPRLCSAVWSQGVGTMACFALGGFVNFVNAHYVNDPVTDDEEPPSPPASFASASSVASSEESYTSTMRSSMLGYPELKPRTAAELPAFRKWILGAVVATHAGASVHEKTHHQTVSYGTHRRTASQSLISGRSNAALHQRSKSSLELSFKENLDKPVPLFATLAPRISASYSVFDFKAFWGASERRFLATNYAVDGLSGSEACFANGKLARERGWKELGSFWMKLGHLFVGAESNSLGAASWAKFPFGIKQLDILLHDLAMAGDLQSLSLALTLVICSVADIFVSPSIAHSTDATNETYDFRRAFGAPCAPPTPLSVCGSIGVIEGTFSEDVVTQHGVSALGGQSTRSSLSSLSLSRSSSTFAGDGSPAKKAGGSGSEGHTYAGRRSSGGELLPAVEMGSTTITVTIFNRQDWYLERALYPTFGDLSSRTLVDEIVRKYRGALLAYASQLALWELWLPLGDLAKVVPEPCLSGASEETQGAVGSGPTRAEALRYYLTVRCLTCGTPLEFCDSHLFKCKMCEETVSHFGTEAYPIFGKVVKEANFCASMAPLPWAKRFAQLCTTRDGANVDWSSPRVLNFQDELTNFGADDVKGSPSSPSKSHTTGASEYGDTDSASAALTYTVEPNFFRHSAGSFEARESTRSLSPTMDAAGQFSVENTPALSSASSSSLQSSATSNSSNSRRTPYQRTDRAAPQPSAKRIPSLPTTPVGVNTRFQSSLDSQASIPQSMPVSISFQQEKNWKLWEDAQQSDGTSSFGTSSSSTSGVYISRLFGDKRQAKAAGRQIESEGLKHDTSGAHKENSRVGGEDERFRLLNGRPRIFVKAPTCSICEIPVSGLMLLCRSCGHGGHVEELQSWFELTSSTTESIECPVPGCGCLCAQMIVDDCDTCFSAGKVA